MLQQHDSDDSPVAAKLQGFDLYWNQIIIFVVSSLQTTYL